MVPLSIFNKSFQKCILLGYFLTPQIPGSSLRNILERQESSGRLWLRKRLLYEKQPAKNATCFRIFIVPILICLFRERVQKTSSKFLLCRKILHFGNSWQLSDYRKYPLSNSINLQRNVFFVCLVYVNCRYMRYVVFPVCRISANCCFIITKQSHIIQPF